MNTQLEEFINKKKIEKIEEQKKKRDEHLVSLGLVDESKTIKVRKYYEYDIPGCKFDSHGYYKEVESYVPIEITDEEYEELLKYVPAPISTIQQEEEEQSAKWANRIKIISTLSLIVSIILVLCGIIVGMEFVVIGLSGILYYPMIRGFAKIVEVS